MAKQKTEAQTDRYNRYGSPLQWVGAAIIGSVSAASTFINLVRSKFHEDNEFRQGFSVLHRSKNAELEHLNNHQIEETLKILHDYVGDHPSYKEFIRVRGLLNLEVSATNTGFEHLTTLKRDTSEVLSGPAANKAKLTDETADLLKAYSEANDKFMRDCKEGIERGMQSSAYKKLAMSGSKRASGVKVRFDRLYDDFAETMYGIKSKGIIGHTQGVWERFVAFGGYTKRNMLFKTAVAFGVAFGGTMMVFNQLNTRDKLNEIDKQSERADRKIDALLEKSGIRDEEISTRAEHRIKVKQREKIENAMTRKSGSHVAKIMEDRAESAEASHNVAI